MLDVTPMRSPLIICALTLTSACTAKPDPAVDQATTDDKHVEQSATPATPATPVTPAPTPTEVPASPDASIRAAAETVREWVAAHPNGGTLPKQLFRPTSPLTLAIETDACDDGDEGCVSRLDLPNAAAFEAWLTENVGEVPGMEVSSKIESCNDAHCCTFANLGHEAAKEDGMVPHELMELRAVCFEMQAQTVLGVRRMKFVKW